MSSGEKKHASVGCIVLSIFCIAILATLFAVIFHSQKYESRLELDGTAGGLIPIYRYNHEKSALEELIKLPVGRSANSLKISASPTATGAPSALPHGVGWIAMGSKDMCSQIH